MSPHHALMLLHVTPMSLHLVQILSHLTPSVRLFHDVSQLAKFVYIKIFLVVEPWHLRGRPLGHLPYATIGIGAWTISKHRISNRRTAIAARIGINAAAISNDAAKVIPCLTPS